MVEECVAQLQITAVNVNSVNLVDSAHMAALQVTNARLTDFVVPNVVKAFNPQVLAMKEDVDKDIAAFLEISAADKTLDN